MKKIALIVLLAMFALCGAAFAAEATLKWDANTPTPTGYRAFARVEGQLYDYTKPAWTGTATTCKVAAQNDAKNYFVVRAYVKSTVTGLESVSGDSNEVLAAIAPTVPDNPKGLILQAIDEIIQGLNMLKEAVGKM